MTDMPRYSSASAEQPQAQAPVAPPAMNIVFWLFLGAGVMSVIFAAFSVMYAKSEQARADMENVLASQNMGEVTAEMLDVIINISVTTAIIIGVISAIAYVVTAIFLKKGKGWARIVAAVLVALSLGNLVGMTMPAAIPGILQVLMGIAAVVLCFTGAGAAYFRARKDHRLATKTR